MAAVLADLAIYGLPFVLGLGALKVLQGRYYGRKKPPKPWVVAMLASITSVSFHIDAQGVKIELKRTQEQLASLQNDNFGLASAACVE
jgi:hypothetical protein